MPRQSKAKRADELERFIFDATGFLGFAFKNNLNDSQVLETLAHDIGGLCARKECFSPRVTGYGAKYNKS